MKRTILVLIALVFILVSCKTSTQPEPEPEIEVVETTPEVWNVPDARVESLDEEAWQRFLDSLKEPEPEIVPEPEPVVEEVPIIEEPEPEPEPEPEIVVEPEPEPEVEPEPIIILPDLDTAPELPEEDPVIEIAPAELVFAGEEQENWHWIFQEEEVVEPASIETVKSVEPEIVEVGKTVEDVNPDIIAARAKEYENLQKEETKPLSFMDKILQFIYKNVLLLEIGFAAVVIIILIIVVVVKAKKAKANKNTRETSDDEESEEIDMTPGGPINGGSSGPFWSSVNTNQSEEEDQSESDNVDGPEPDEAGPEDENSEEDDSFPEFDDIPMTDM